MKDINGKLIRLGQIVWIPRKDKKMIRRRIVQLMPEKNQVGHCDPNREYGRYNLKANSDASIVVVCDNLTKNELA